MRLAVATADIRTWNGEHRERDGKGDASSPDRAPEFAQADDGGAAFVWSLIARLFQSLEKRDR